VVGSLRAPLDFRSLAGQTQYLQAVQQQYTELQASWLTPVEIFQPHYGRAIAACILQRWQQQTEAAAGAAAGGTLQQVQQERQHAEQLPLLQIFEIGGGTGTLARNILVRFFAADAICSRCFAATSSRPRQPTSGLQCFCCNKHTLMALA
jgi:hypothetical protein